MKSKLSSALIMMLIVTVAVSAAIAAPRNELTMRFIKVLNISSNANVMDKMPGGTQITPLFIRSTDKGDIDLTMLIAYDERIAQIARQIISNSVTPLIFSVSTMPFVSMRFQPEQLIFQQNGKKWSPSNLAGTNDMFPLDDNIPFGGQINDSQLHQGVILLPAWFDINKPIEINYNNFRKLCQLK
ncbi:MAG: hypothetical protein ONB16_04485 [candidate division KSB1 bacterium]|nr:hypothetical protein [candidate division KSB1 bacterium]MDZ7318394.1 hypothetical protein [candidate division KSB1 bacterium]MDZ7340068.1 hypothetical protein [candidate division KSB1 bacterium]